MATSLLAPTRTPSVRERLREATLEVHERLHGLQPFKAIEAETLPPAEYGRLLVGLNGFHWRVESALRRCGLGDLTTGAARLAALRRDLRALGLAPEPPRLWRIAGGRGFLLGCAYVAQGSTLGGRLIARQLDYMFGRADCGRSFFAGSPEDGLAWRRLCRLIEDEADLFAEMLQGADAAFELFEISVEEFA